MHFLYKQHKAPGQVMLISILVLGFLTLTSIIIGIASIVRESQSTVAMENKSLAVAATTACLEQAMDRLGRNANYTGNEVLDVASSTCSIRPIIYNDSTWTIEAYSQINDQVARYRIILNSRSPVVISSWAEVATF